MNPIEVIVRRGGIVEARHTVHAVAVQDGAVVGEAGDSNRVAFLRSSAKPFQALPLVRARDDLTPEEIAIGSASPLAHPPRSPPRAAPRTPPPPPGPPPRPAQPARKGSRRGRRARVRS